MRLKNCDERERIKLNRLRGDGADITVEEAKRWYQEGWISDDGLEEALETAIKQTGEAE
jgi:hypothetical protein